MIKSIFLSSKLILLFTAISCLNFSSSTDSSSLEAREVNVIKNDYSALLENEKNSIDIYRRVAPSVVNVTNIQVARSFWDPNPIEVPRGSGSGFVWDQDGHIVTNAHVIQGGSRFVVNFQNDPNPYEAKLVASEPRKDIAVLKLEKKPKKLIPINIASSNDLMVGQKAIAIGNPFGFDHSMSVGTVSALGRKIDGIGGVKIHDMIQTDAAINVGNSGGPLLNSQGNLIGMNTVIISQTGGSVGLGFAVPADAISTIVPQLIVHGKIIRPGMGIGILEDQYANYFGIKEGLVIKFVEEDSSADKAGLRGMRRDQQGRYILGDILLSIDEKPVNSFDDIFHILEKYKVGDEVEITYLREDKKQKAKVKLMSLN